MFANILKRSNSWFTRSITYIWKIYKNRVCGSAIKRSWRQSKGPNSMKAQVSIILERPASLSTFFPCLRVCTSLWRLSLPACISTICWWSSYLFFNNGTKFRLTRKLSIWRLCVDTNIYSSSCMLLANEQDYSWIGTALGQSAADFRPLPCLQPILAKAYAFTGFFFWQNDFSGLLDI